MQNSEFTNYEAEIRGFAQPHTGSKASNLESPYEYMQGIE